MDERKTLKERILNALPSHFSAEKDTRMVFFSELAFGGHREVTRRGVALHKQSFAQHGGDLKPDELPVVSELPPTAPEYAEGKRYITWSRFIRISFCLPPL